jgi:hypothetical protein
MARPGMEPDVLEALADFAELERLRAERRRSAQVVESSLGWSDSQLMVAFEVMELHVAEGLRLAASASLAGVTPRTLAAWVKLADARRAPWDAWLDGIMRRDAQRRRQFLRDLRKIAAVDARALGDLTNQIGRPSQLECEVEGLRRWKTATVDVLIMPSDADRNRASDTADAMPGRDHEEADTP